jgi:hypothetical protein
VSGCPTFLRWPKTLPPFGIPILAVGLEEPQEGPTESQLCSRCGEGIDSNRPFASALPSGFGGKIGGKRRRSSAVTSSARS